MIRKSGYRFSEKIETRADSADLFAAIANGLWQSVPGTGPAAIETGQNEARKQKKIEKTEKIEKNRNRETFKGVATLARGSRRCPLLRSRSCPRQPVANRRPRRRPDLRLLLL
ncbi:MAG: hypothetical protein ACLP8B_12640, partial [Xanthobacteraceae bacterium]